jgi:hypothetical protein
MFVKSWGKQLNSPHSTKCKFQKELSFTILNIFQSIFVRFMLKTCVSLLWKYIFLIQKVELRHSIQFPFSEQKLDLRMLICQSKSAFGSNRNCKTYQKTKQQQSERQ